MSRPSLTPSAAPPRRAPAVRALLFAPLLALGLLLGPGVLAASAHSELLDSDPAEGSTVEEVPEQFRLTFNETPQEIGAALQLTGPDGEVTWDAEPTVEGNDLVVDTPAELVDGDYTLVFRVTSADGHPISGELAFSLALASGGGATDDPTTEEPTTQDPTTEEPTTQEPTSAGSTTDDATSEDATTTTDDQGAATSTEDPTSSTDDGTTAADDQGATTAPGDATTVGTDEEVTTEDEGSNLPLIVGIGVVVLAVAGVGVYLAYRSGTRSEDDTDGPGGSAGGEGSGS